MLQPSDVNGIRLEDGYVKSGGQDPYVALISILKSDYPMHFHNFYEMELVVEGHGYQQINGRKLSVHPGSFYLVTPKDIHGYFVDDEIKIISIHIMDYGMDSMLKNALGYAQCMHYVELNNEQFGHIHYAMSMLASIFIRGADSRPQYANPLLATLVSYIVFASETVVFENLSLQTSSTFRRIQEYIERNFAQPLRLTEVAEYAYLHPCYLSSMFSKWFGCSFPTYINRYRLERAATLLTVTDASISEIAYSAGFGNLSHFIRCFKNMYHLSPKVYRIAKKRKSVHETFPATKNIEEVD